MHNTLIPVSLHTWIAEYNDITEPRIPLHCSVQLEALSPSGHRDHGSTIICMKGITHLKQKLLENKDLSIVLPLYLIFIDGIIFVSSKCK